jgi:hypothetical protein
LFSYTFVSVDSKGSYSCDFDAFLQVLILNNLMQEDPASGKIECACRPVKPEDSTQIFGT